MNVINLYYLHEIGGKKNQEDYIWPVPGTAAAGNKVFIVCDGVGGSENGEVASRLIAEYMGSVLLKTPETNISTAYINRLLSAAKETLVTHSRVAGLNKDMATTFSLLVLFSNKAFIAWCGDSRVYHIRNGEILYKTADHSLVNTLVKNGEITEAEALSHPQKHIILKAVTADDSIAEAEGHWISNPARGDYFMLCTDGLLENITEDDLKALPGENQAAHTDIVAAMQEKCFGKTRDNYSMYLLQVAPETSITAKRRNKTARRLPWLLVLVLAAAAASLWFLNDRNAASMPAAAIKPDTAATRPADSSAKKDTVLQPGRNAVADTLINKEEPEEKKIVPVPLPEATPAGDSAIHKKTKRKSPADTVFVNPQTLIKNTQPDSSTKHPGQ